MIIIKLLIFPFVLLLICFSVLGSIFEYVLTFWMEEPVTFWSDLRKELTECFLNRQFFLDNDCF